jgi:ribosomal protein S27AE
MIGPGEYIPDVTEGITSVEDLPKPRTEQRSRNYRSRRCPRCGHRAGRYAVDTRTLHDLGDVRSGRPIDLVVTFSKHHCPDCDYFFAADLTDLARPKAHYTGRVQNLAVRLVAEDGLPYQAACWHLWRDHRVFVPHATIQNWVEAAGEKKGRLSVHYLPR